MAVNAARRHGDGHGSAPRGALLQRGGDEFPAGGQGAAAAAAAAPPDVPRCDPRVLDTSGQMPHQWAAFYNCVPVLEVLLGAGGVPPDAEANGIPALHFAVAHGKMEAAMLLLERGADPLRLHVGEEGRTRQLSKYATYLGYRKLGRTLREREEAALAARQKARWGAWLLWVWWGFGEEG